MLLTASGLSPLPVRAADENVTLNFAQADIETVVKAMGQITNKNFVLDPRVKGTMNIVSARPVSKKTAYDMFLSALRLQGFVALEARGVVKIIPETDAKYAAPPVTNLPAREAKNLTGERLVTQTFLLKHESAAALLPILRPIISPNNTINAYPSNNSLVITDYADNVARIARIVESVDQPSLNAPQIVPLKHASAADVAQMLVRLADTNGTPASEGAQKIAVLADLRTNSIILRGENPSKVAQLRTLAESLDKPSGDGKGQLRVVYLKNAEAIKVAEMLRSVSGGGVTTSGTTPTGAAAAGGVVSTTVGSSGVTIQADIASNAILINATEPVYNNLRAVIEQLDAKRAQIFVEALIVEVSTDNAAEFGIQWQDFTGLNSTKTRVIGGTNFGGAGTNIIGTATSPTSIGGGLNVGIIRGTVNIPGIGAITNLGLLARALDKTTKANILSTPNVVTLDNEEAKIVIGQNVPFITGQYAQTGTAGAAGSTTPSPFQTIERRDVGLTLRIKPQITEGGQIKLKIFQEASSVQDRTNAAGIITNKRSIESVVEVEDGRIIALGGLLEDKFDNGVDKVPIAGDLPFFGNLFKYETRRQVKTNLMVFLRPVILRDQPSAQGISLDRYDLLLKAQERTQPASSAVLPDMQTPLLAPLKLSPTMAPAKP